MRATANLLRTHPSPVVEAKGWVSGRVFPDEKLLIDVSQAAPSGPPPLALREAMAEEILTETGAHLYGPVLGNAPLRAALAQEVSDIYGGAISEQNVAITQGCNQAFTVAIQAIASAGDNVMLTVPWYFNHKMWLDMCGIDTLPLPVGPDMIPDPDQARTLLTPKTRAIVLVTPNNPAGVEYPAETLAAFRDIAREKGIPLILDETYRDFLAQSERPHDLFSDPEWDDTLIQLYSFSKAYRLTGHRVGGIIAGTALLNEMEKILDTVSISASQIGQRAALWGLENLSDWRAGERDEIARRRGAAQRHLGQLEGWRLRSLGAYFAWIDHPFDASSDQVAIALVETQHVLSLPGTAFAPAGTQTAQKGLRIAFPNVDVHGLSQLHRRLQAAVDLPPL